MKANITQHPCKHCKELHALYYCVADNGFKHLFYECVKTDRRVYIPMISGLNIPIRKRVAAEKREQREAKQPTLL